MSGARVAEASDEGGAERGVIALDEGGEIAFEVTGPRDAQRVLLVRPLAGSMALWGDFADRLARRYRVVAFDHRGVGDSSDAPVDVSTRSMARDAVAVLDALGVERAHVFGVSLGAMVATWVAVDAPDRVERLCLACAGPTGLTLSAEAPAKGAEVARALVAPEDEAIPRLAAAMRADGDPGELARGAGESVRKLEVLKHAAAAALHDASGALASVRAPTLVLAAGEDPVMGTAGPRALAEGIAGARFEVIEGAGHDVTAERPEAVASRVAAFFGAD